MEKVTHMKKKLMLIVNPAAGRGGYKQGFTEALKVLDDGGFRTTLFIPPPPARRRPSPRSTPRTLTPSPVSAATARSARSLPD